jgi:uncharacterized protein YjaZ
VNVNLHVLDARGTMSALRSRVEGAFLDSVRRVSLLLPIDTIDVVVSCSKFVVPETGFGGYCPSADVLYIWIDPQNPNLLANFDAEFLATLGHELHHCMRNRGPGYGRTLGEALVSEGLACHFETELRGGAVPFYARALDAGSLTALRERAHAARNSSYNHRAWFFGSQSEGIPMYAGYSVGFSIVGHYMDRHGIQASRLWNAPADAFFPTS